jgi:hypothetical protein
MTAFRPTKINNPEAPNGADALERTRAMQQAIADEVGGEMPETMKQAPASLPNNLPFQVQGDVPPEFQKMMRGMNTPPKKSGMNFKEQKTFTNNPAPISTNNMSEQLRDILQRVKQTSAVFEEVLLPSLGKFYDGTDGPVDGVLRIRPMTGDDQQIMASPRLSKNSYSMINLLLNRCIKENQYKVENLLTIDKYYLMLYLRGISESTIYNVEIRCPTTDKKFEYAINLAQLPIDNCPEDYGPVLTGKLPVSGLNFTYRLSRGKDDEIIEKHKEYRLQNFGGDSDDSVIFSLALLTEELEGLTAKKDIETVIRSLVFQDINYLRNMINEPPFGVDTKIPIISPYSMEEFEVQLPIDVNFFFPRQKKVPRDQN